MNYLLLKTYKLKILAFLIIVFCFSACTVLQWRDSDKEISSSFKEINIPTTIDYFKIDSLDINIRTQHIQNSENKINLLFLHGSPSSLSAWNGYLKDTNLLKAANIHAVDRPGYGYSNFGKELPEIEPQSQVINQFINHYKLKNVITIGASYGGPLAARLAAINSNVKGVIMISPAIDPNQEKDIWGAKLTQYWLTRWLVPRGYRVAGDEKTIHAVEMAKIDSEWNKVTIPVIHIHGDNDELVPYSYIEYTQQKFPNIEIVTIPNAGHEISWFSPELVKPSIYKMIATVEKSKD